MTDVPGGPARISTGELVYDTRAQPLTAGVRSAMQRGRRLLYAVEDTELLLQISPAGRPRHVRLFGQFLTDGEPVEGAAFSLRGPAVTVDGETDEDGEFRVADLLIGQYDLDVRASDGVMRVQAVDVA
jgi:hypothetical protein